VLSSVAVAELHVLADGYALDDESGNSSVGSTVSFVRDGDALIVIDPGMVKDRSAILTPLKALGVAPEEVTDVVISHHHPDHTVNIALFPNARVHDNWAIYQGDTWIDRPAEGYAVSPGVALAETPGHTPQDITTLVTTDSGLYACTHLWWDVTGPDEDPLAADPDALQRSRTRILGLDPVTIVPGHGGAFATKDLGQG